MMTSTTVATLVAMTQEGERALGGTRELRVAHFPFKAGRERRLSDTDGPRPPEAEQRRQGVEPEFNDVYLLEPPSASALHISGAHFAIECVDNRFFLVDRGSACGTIVAGTRVGGDRKGGRTELRGGDEVIVGTGRSRYVFRFQISTE